jgi:hypothetical protein
LGSEEFPNEITPSTPIFPVRFRVSDAKKTMCKNKYKSFIV